MNKDIKKVEIIGGEYRITIAGICGLPDITYRIDKTVFDNVVKQKELTINRKPYKSNKGRR